MSLLTARPWILLAWLGCLVWAWAEVTRKPVPAPEPVRELSPEQWEAAQRILELWQEQGSGGMPTGFGSQTYSGDRRIYVGGTVERSVLMQQEIR